MNNETIRKLRATVAEKYSAEAGCRFASEGEIKAAELKIGFHLWPCHKLILSKVSNGGFGPGEGLIGVGETNQGAEHELVEVWESHLDTRMRKELKILPLCDWGAGVWSWIDCQTGEVLTFSEFGLYAIGVDFEGWITAWSDGHDWWDDMLDVETNQTSGTASSKITRYLGNKGRPIIRF